MLHIRLQMLQPPLNLPATGPVSLGKKTRASKERPDTSLPLKKFMAPFYVGSAGSEFTGMRPTHFETPLVEGLEDHEIMDFWVTAVITFTEKAFLAQCTKLSVHEEGGGGVGFRGENWDCGAASLGRRNSLLKA